MPLFSSPITLSLVATILSLLFKRMFLSPAPPSNEIIKVLPRGGGGVVYVKSRKSLGNGNGNGKVKGRVSGEAKLGNAPVAEKNGKEQDEARPTVAQFILENCPSLRKPFVPSWWLWNGHLQTMYSVVGNFNKVDHITYERTLIEVRDGGTVSIDISPPTHTSLPPSAPTIIIAHGLTGGSHESYVRNILSWVVKPKSEGGLGGRGVVANCRGCAGTPVTSTQFYSAGYTGDYHHVVSYISQKFPQSPLIGMGFSLGASVVTRYMGEQGERCLLKGGMAMGCPWKIREMSVELEEGWFSSRVYSSAMGHNLTRTMGQHLAPAFFPSKHPKSPFSPTAYDASTPPPEVDYASTFGDLSQELIRLEKKGRHLRLIDFDDAMTAKVGGLHRDKGGVFPLEGSKGYYEWASCYTFLDGVKRPLLAVNAFDDPIVHGSALPVEEVEKSSHVVMAVTARGGHLGWFNGPLFSSKSTSRCPQQRWILQPVQEYVNAIVEHMDLAHDNVPSPRKTRTEGEWTWIEGSEEELYGPFGWKVVQEGKRIEGAESSGVLAGL